jgi:type III secretion protein W
MQLIWAESNPKLVKAGMNVGIKAQLFAKKMAVTPWALRETYRQFLSSNEGEIIQYEQWVEQYGNGRRHLVAEFIETALLHDIQSHDPSCSRDEFGSLLNHVVTFKKLRFSDKAFMQVFLKGSKHESNREIEALACWFDCLQRPFKIQKEIEKNRLSQLMERLNLTQPVLIQKMIAAVKVLDADLFFDVAVKDILIQALLNMEKKP